MIERIATLTRASFGPLIGLALAGYFLHFLLEGERGLDERVRLAGELEAAQTALAEVRAERETLEARVAALRPGALNPDLLDEEARRAFRMLAPGEIAVPLP